MFISALSGVRVVMSATTSACRQRSIRLDSHFFCRGLFYIYIICIVLRILVWNTISCCPSCCYFYLHGCSHVGLFHFRLGLRAFNLVKSLYIYKIKTKNNYRSRWCIQINFRSVSSRYVNISFPVYINKYILLMVRSKYQFIYGSNIKIILYLKMKTNDMYAITVLSYKTNK